ncbi:MAG: hypothetical protein MHM6MM_007419 [Cercozoa sp. M6MM]
MVDASELPFRALCRSYGTTLCYTPMFNAKMWAAHPKNRRCFHTTNQLDSELALPDRPLFVQFCSNEPQQLLEAAQRVQRHCDAVDINFGCPQGIARKGNYGSFLLEQPQVMKSLIETLAQAHQKWLRRARPEFVSNGGDYPQVRADEDVLADELCVPVTAKIRVLPTLEATLRLARMCQDAGAQVLCVHGRTKEQNKHKVGKCFWSAITAIKRELNIPVFANGGIETLADAAECVRVTGVDGVMAAEGLLANPALFSGRYLDPLDVAEAYLRHCAACNEFATQHALPPPKKLKKSNSSVMTSSSSSGTNNDDSTSNNSSPSVLPVELFTTGPVKGSSMKKHMFQILYRYLQIATHIRAQLGQARTLEEYQATLQALRDFVAQSNEDSTDQESSDTTVNTFWQRYRSEGFSWYRRYYPREACDPEFHWDDSVEECPRANVGKPSNGTRPRPHEATAHVVTEHTEHLVHPNTPAPSKKPKTG